MNYHLPAKLERIETKVDVNLKIEAYGKFNLYPQKQDFLRLNSPLVKTACAVLEDFVNGSGWTTNGDQVLNDEGELADDLLNFAAMDFSRFNGFALWLGFDGTGSINEVKHIPFEYVRYGIPDAMGKHDVVRVSNNWEQESDSIKEQPTEARTYPLFNPLTAAEETLNGGEGQVLYFTGIKDKYPLSTFDSINDTAITDSEVQAFEKNTATKGFLGTTLFKYPGQFESEQEQRDMVAKVQQLQGSDSPGILLAQIDEDFTGSLIETIAPNNNDALFSLTRQAIIDRVLQVFAIPPALMGINPQGGVFTQQAYLDSFIIYNVSTRNSRKKIARIFNTIGALLDTPLAFGDILENQYDVQGEEEIEEIEETPVEGEEVEVVEEPTEAKIKKIYG